jgi:hypothetical protein
MNNVVLQNKCLTGRLMINSTTQGIYKLDYMLTQTGVKILFKHLTIIISW